MSTVTSTYQCTEDMQKDITQAVVAHDHKYLRLMIALCALITVATAIVASLINPLVWISTAVTLIISIINTVIYLRFQNNIVESQMLRWRTLCKGTSVIYKISFKNKIFVRTESVFGDNTSSYGYDRIEDIFKTKEYIIIAFNDGSYIACLNTSIEGETSDELYDRLKKAINN